MPDEPQVKTTWDGKPISPEMPYGVLIIVYRPVERGYEFLILHRAHNGKEYEGEWAWTPPSGSRFPGESVGDCVRRELREETGLSLPVRATPYGSAEWQTFVAEASIQDKVQLLDGEHDRYQWVPIEVAVSRCLPEAVSDSLRAVGADLAIL